MTTPFAIAGTQMRVSMSGNVEKMHKHQLPRQHCGIEWDRRSQSNPTAKKGKA